MFNKIAQLRHSDDAENSSFSDARPLNTKETDEMFAAFIQAPQRAVHVESVATQASHHGSIGQVYVGRLVNVTPTVCFKVKYVGLASRVREQLSLLNKVAWAARVAGYKSIGGTDKELTDMITLECDMTLEKNNQALMSRVFASSHATIAIPRLFEALCSDNVVCMQYMDAYVPFAEFIRHAPSASACTRVLEILTDFCFQVLTRNQLLYTDVHFGNFLIDPQSLRVCVIDFGSLKYFTVERCAALTRLIAAILTWENDSIGDEFARAGFVLPVNPAHKNALLAGIKALFAPLVDDCTFVFEQAWLTRIRTIVYGELGKQIVAPPDVMWLFRVIFGLASIGVGMNAHANLHAVVKKLFCAVTACANDE